MTAFEGTAVGADAEHAELLRAVDRVSREANLCMSFVHLYELLRGSDEDARLTCAVWLDHLDTVWLRFPEDIPALELENLLCTTAAGQPLPPPVPAVPSFLSLFPYAADDTALSWALQRNSLAAFAREIGTSKVRERIESIAALSIEGCERLWHDRKRGLAEHSEAEMRTTLEQKHEAALIQEALEVSRRLVHDSRWRKRQGALFVVPDDDFVRATIRPMAEIKGLLPYWYLHQRAWRNRSFQLVRKTSPKSKRFARATRGDAFDYWHLVGAAYCDLFSCDEATSHALDHGREELGLAPESVSDGISVGALAARVRSVLKQGAHQ